MRFIHRHSPTEYWLTDDTDDGRPSPNDFITSQREHNRQRAVALGFSESEVRLAPGANVRLGDFGRIEKGAYIGLYSYINGDVIVEEDVLIGPHCVITSNTHLFNVEQQNFRGKNANHPIVIGRGSWISSGVIITSGTKLGKANLVVANTVVTSDTPDYAIVGGTPGKVLGTVNPTTGTLEWFSKQKEGNETKEPERVQEPETEEKDIFKDQQKESEAQESRIDEVHDYMERYLHTKEKYKKQKEKLKAVEEKYNNLEERLKKLENLLPSSS